MDFFTRQDNARKQTKLLVGYYALAILLIVTCVYFAALFLVHGAGARRPSGPMPTWSLWHPQIFMYAAAGTLLVILGGSAIKIAELSSGGGAVAESLGGRLLDSNTTVPNERKLLNVIEEMAIASGVPVPKVYLLEAEHGINAFAAGHTLNDAAIGVTQGCIDTLNRDELQGVIGHEFSHILNGDMRLNVRLMGILFGLLCLAVIGRTMLRVRGGSRDRGALPLFGIALLALGWIGVFFGQLIQAAISRQREFLADASAVQFTRNPDGLARALKKIGAAQLGSQIENEHAAEASHMFFGNAMTSSWFNAFATHPPLAERIRALDPHWDGTFDAPFPPTTEAIEPVVAKSTARPFPPILPGFPTNAAGLVGGAARVQTADVLTTLGNPTPKHLRYAVALRKSLPPAVRAAARDPHGACAILFALVLSDEGELRRAQLDHLSGIMGANLSAQADALSHDATEVTQRARLPLVNLALPALRQLPPQEFDQFLHALNWLIESDQKIVLFEFMLQKIVRRQIEPHFIPTRPAVVQYYSVKPLLPECAVLLSALAYVGQSEPAAIAAAFEAGAPLLRAPATLSLLPAEQCGLRAIDQALERLAQAAPQIKKNLLTAGLQVVGADGMIQEAEAELLRAMAETLDCPIPPFVNDAD